MSLVFMFPGQGSQSVGMMADLLASSEKANQVFAEASDAIGIDLRKLALEGPEERINQTEITQPLILTASIAVWEEWCAQTTIRPDFMCGHSLGEYTALVASGAISLSDAVKLVHLRGQLMQQAVPLGQGAMAALLGLDDETVIKVCEEASSVGVVSAANFNSPGQVVIAGANDALEKAIELAREAGARRAAMLPVSVPCHCALLEPAGEKLAEAINAISFSEPQVPIVQNYTATVAESIEDLKANLLPHLSKAVQWTKSVRYLADQGATQFVECGPGKVLAGLTRRVDKSLENFAISDGQGITSTIASLSEEA
ncbi:malonyl CoA-acyl carrier protein transacylase [Oleiphilus sp. HI0009]|nr:MULTISPECIES: ACP S-malonyltransferase [unclassified Oleiphilus]KZX75683.1 malonyl CoA-acyl carrier protein transacylase [Oleiphilus sp. HI0009]KZY63103.1 malonyl CoA-acyl carrier protein transacylase [Oleiphilus sp. HI0066]KZY69712.1 malonyl CoA-acyl carrier protein transacylase [Oleiphilus sp. HI0067]